jgi:hypothetical protein
MADHTALVVAQAIKSGSSHKAAAASASVTIVDQTLENKFSRIHARAPRENIGAATSGSGVERTKATAMLTSTLLQRLARAIEIQSK